MKILLVDDDIVSLRLQKLYLEKNSHTVETASFVLEAKAVLERHPDIALIISDVMMPNLDGFDFLQYLKSDMKLSRIPVVLCTSLNNEESVVKARDLNVAGFLVKPFDEKALIDKIKQIQQQNDRTILIVDDEETVIGLLARMLERERWTILTAANGEQAINQIKENKINIVISDIYMPGMSGIDLLLQIKELDPALPVILISGQAKWGRDQVIAAGADEFIAKPFRPMDILASIENVLERKKYANINRR
jgi:CheY-like chemotaxis protein